MEKGKKDKKKILNEIPESKKKPSEILNEIPIHENIPVDTDQKTNDKLNILLE